MKSAQIALRHVGLSVNALLCLALLGCGEERFEERNETAEAVQAVGSWAYTNPMSVGRIMPTATTLLDGSVLVTGGWLSFANLLSSAERYDPTTNSFSSAGSMQVVRWSHAATLLNDGAVLVTGGEMNGNVYHTAADRYDPLTNAWAAVAPMQYARRAHLSVRLNDGRVLVAGGDRDTNDRSAEIYNPATNMWSSAGLMNEGRHDPRGTVLADGRVFVVGGILGASTRNSAEIYNPATNTWSTVSSMTYPRYAHTVTLLADGRVLVAGGADTDGFYAVPIWANAEIYNPATNSWSGVVGMTAARESHTATRMRDDRVLLAGGSGLTSSEIFDPATNTFSAAPSMNTIRVDHAAAALPDGSVLVVGGLPGSNNNSDIYAYASLSSAERIQASNVLDEIWGLAAGANHALAIVGAASSASVYSWGATGNGRLGRTGDNTSPFVVSTLAGNVALPIDAGKRTIAAGGSHSLVVLTDGRIAAFGADGAGQVGNGLPMSSSVTTPVTFSLPSGAKAVSVAAGTQHSLALDETGAVWAWGTNTDGQLGDGTTTSHAGPIQVVGLPLAARAIAAGGDHSLVILADGSMRAFGRNDFGQLGAGFASPFESTPRSVSLPVAAMMAEAGTNHTIMLAANGAVYTWGSDGSQQLGNGAGVTHQYLPAAPVALGAPAISVAAGGSHSIVLLSDGTARSFGADSAGQLGNDPVFTNRNTPQPVAGVTNAFAIAAGTSYSLFGAKTLAMNATGSDANGQLGNGAVTTTNQPVPVSFMIVP